MNFEIGDKVTTVGHSAALDGKEWIVEGVSGNMVKINGYIHYINSLWLKHYNELDRKD